IDWPIHPTEADARKEYDRIWSLLGSRAIEDVIDLPPMHDTEALATLDVLTSLDLAALYIDRNLHALSVCAAVTLSLAHGNSDRAPYNYVAIGLLASARFADYTEGYRFGRLACDLLERREWDHSGGHTYFRFAALIPWTRPLRDGIDPARRAFELAKRHGDLT